MTNQESARFEERCHEARVEGDRRRVARGGRRAGEGLEELANRMEAAALPALHPELELEPGEMWREHLGRAS